jgi:hypothetical protein
MTLFRTNEQIEWYKVNDNYYEGWNKKTEERYYTLIKDQCGLWILRGQGMDATNYDENYLMNKIKL